jgi:hypothetical protein
MSEKIMLDWGGDEKAPEAVTVEVVAAIEGAKAATVGVAAVGI